ncbi:MgtC/SapB family protein [Enterocloster clostridioformis]|uniref:Putative Mg2+ transporter-C (MgtC) family protein n=2 Tax=Enterocloster clostridioformis TaxID=1531 RepID=A0A1I0JDU0_9FIRM|nr:MgtC/SapB family protein [Enterocloster clostridioformis]SEU08285.1 putative Mg2+ transporter-C (MgtC) family protein [Enterocloster clostridioformis]SEW45279.1 putative Mg2+ transporter-C (MgtC) family protein [Enterocloster clostridioformis]
MEGWSSLAIVGRLALAILTGTVIGIDRGLKRRGAGIKTHSLVCLGSTLVMLTSEYMAMNFDQKADLARLGAQVISGVGFLGVGTILVTEKQRIKGLTTAAGLWTCACVGLAIGIGFVEGAIYSLIFMIPGSKGWKSDASLLAGGFLTLGPAKNMNKKPFFEEK